MRPGQHPVNDVGFAGPPSAPEHFAMAIVAVWHVVTVVFVHLLPPLQANPSQQPVYETGDAGGPPDPVHISMAV